MEGNGHQMVTFVFIKIALKLVLANQAIEITKELYLNWTAIDWRRDKGGEYYFLEANPSPMFIGFEKQSGISMSDYIVDYMLEH